LVQEVVELAVAGGDLAVADCGAPRPVRWRKATAALEGPLEVFAAAGV
jgi:hypothetical protein